MDNGRHMKMRLPLFPSVGARAREPGNKDEPLVAPLSDRVFSPCAFARSARAIDPYSWCLTGPSAGLCMALRRKRRGPRRPETQELDSPSRPARRNFGEALTIPDERGSGIVAAPRDDRGSPRFLR